MDQITHVGWNLLESSSFSQSLAPLGSLIQRTTIFSLGKKKIFLYISPKGPSPASWQYVIELVYLSQEQAAVLRPCRISFYSSLIQMYPIMSIVSYSKESKTICNNSKGSLIPKESDWDLHLFQFYTVFLLMQPS